MISHMMARVCSIVWETGIPEQRIHKTISRILVQSCFQVIHTGIWVYLFAARQSLPNACDVEMLCSDLVEKTSSIAEP